MDVRYLLWTHNIRWDFYTIVSSSVSRLQVTGFKSQIVGISPYLGGISEDRWTLGPAIGRNAGGSVSDNRC